MMTSISQVSEASKKQPCRSSKGDKKKPQSIRRHKPKIDKRTKTLFRKRARQYNSDDEDEESSPTPIPNPNSNPRVRNAKLTTENEEVSEDEGDSSGEDAFGEKSGSEDDEIQPGITKFSEGVRAFSVAFNTITRKNIPDVALGPVLSGHMKLVAEKLAEEKETQHKLKGEAKKHKYLVAEKGHVKPAHNFLDSHEKFLIGVATKGVVKLFNAVNKAQHAQKGLNPSRSKDAKVIGKRRREAFLSGIGKKPRNASDTRGKGPKPSEKEDDGPAWAPLRDSYMLTSSKLKNWDKMPETVEDDMGEMRRGSSDDED
ncbi:hypothetical protein GIB67_037805 [Kingdonia uniflora]|uniref:RRP15-like protein n=1 Tax=Kingdonia uniflora TaxID=39325 RepID=A0A7J7LV67_9MAGN|nr:hypothetical protein GIB67_037805 [Kingdonia uniflora]